MYIQPYMKSIQRVYSTVSISYTSYGIVRDRSQVLHPTPGVHTRIYTIAIRPILFKYTSRMVQYGYSRSYTTLYVHTRPLCVQSSCTIIRTRTQRKTEVLPHSTARSTRVLAAYFIVEWSYFSSCG